MVNLNQPIRITTTRVLLVAGVGALLLLHKQAQHHAALPSHPHIFHGQHGPDHIRRPPAPPVTMPPRVVEKVVERPVVVEKVVEKVVERVVERPAATPAPIASRHIGHWRGITGASQQQRAAGRQALSRQPASHSALWLIL